MRYIAWFLLLLTFLPMFAQNAVPSVIRDRKVLPKRLWDAYDKADADLESCTDPAKAREPSWRKEDAIRQQFAAAAQYRIQRLPEAKQAQVLKEVYELGKVTERIRIAPWTGTGSQESAFRALEEQKLLFHFIKIWTLLDPQYEQWQKISFAKFIFEGQTYQLKNGISRFVRREDDHYAWWAITILPELFLEYKGNLYALAAVDYRQVHSGDACISCFCKLGRDGTLHTIRRFQEKHLTAMKVTEKGIVFYKWGEYPIEAIPFSEL